MSRKSALVLCFVLLAGSALCQTLPAGVQKKASLGGVTEYDFPNGLRVLLYPDAASPKVTINMTYLVGSRHEGYGETGMAHLLEHMNFIETTNGRADQEGDRRSRRVVEWQHQRGSHQLLRDRPRHRRQSEVGSRAWKPIEWSTSRWRRSCSTRR